MLSSHFPLSIKKYLGQTWEKSMGSFLSWSLESWSAWWLWSKAPQYQAISTDMKVMIATKKFFKRNFWSDFFICWKLTSYHKDKDQAGNIETMSPFPQLLIPRSSGSNLSRLWCRLMISSFWTYIENHWCNLWMVHFASFTHH